MNANELADELYRHLYNDGGYTYTLEKTVATAGTMLRHLQAENEELKAHPVKELTDEEIWDVVEEQMGFTFLGRCYRRSQFEMCKAILRKAQEK